MELGSCEMIVTADQGDLTPSALVMGVGRRRREVVFYETPGCRFIRVDLVYSKQSNRDMHALESV